MSTFLDFDIDGCTSMYRIDTNEKFLWQNNNMTIQTVHVLYYLDTLTYRFTYYERERESGLLNDISNIY